MMEKSELLGKRTGFCGDLRSSHVGNKVTLYGWVQKIRDMGNLVFIDLRDRSGFVQIVVSSDNPNLLKRAKGIKMEYVLGVEGVVSERGETVRNLQIPTGEIEVAAEVLRVLNPSAVLPFIIADPPQAAEELRFKYRYLDLRRPTMQKNVLVRHKAALAVRNTLASQGFYEIETPFLTKSTPEGARDYLVPSRIYKGRFFALPQSPQIFKQLFMIAGFERYFQIVRCFRDEDLRADRQPEFTQIDIEMSFVDRETIFDVLEKLMVDLFGVIGVRVSCPFPRLTYDQVMDTYGSDKPDLRFGMKIRDLTVAGRKIDSNVIRGAMTSGGALKGMVVDRGRELSRSRLDKLNQKARESGGKGIIWIKTGDEFRSSLKLSHDDYSLLWREMDAGDEDLVLLVADRPATALKVLGRLRETFIAEADKKPDEFRFAWITDFPLFEWSEEEDRAVSMHHPFTSPREEDLPMLEKDPLRVRAKAYDLVLNGLEIGGGSIRIHNLELQRRVFNALGLGEEEVEEKFGFFIQALGYGAPPHGGIALGFDRIVMLMAGEESIREVIPFPKTTSSLCLLTESPSPVSESQLAELGLKIRE